MAKRGRKGKTNGRKGRKAKKAVNLTVKCACGATFTRSKFSSNQKYCPKCSRAKKMERIRDNNTMKRYAVSIKNIAAHLGNKAATEKIAAGVRKLKKVSQKFQYVKKNIKDAAGFIKKMKSLVSRRKNGKATA